MGTSLRVVTVLVLVALLAGAGYWLFRDPGGRETAEVEDVTETSEAELPTLRSAEVLDEPSEETIAAEGETEPEAHQEDEDPKAGVRGRCIAAESGEPLAGCKVAFGGWPSSSESMTLHGPVDWEDPDAVVTGDDGQFFIEFEAIPTYRHSLEIQIEGRVSRTGRWRAFSTGQVEDLGDIELSFGAIVKGRVVDGQGQPMEIVGVSVENLPLPIRAGMATSRSRGGSSEADGRFEVEGLVPEGTWPLNIYGRGIRGVSPDSITIEKGAKVVELEVVAERMESIQGFVVDETGAPLQNQVLLETSTGQPFWTAKDSTFTVYGSGEPVSFGCELPREGYEPFETEEKYEWGARGVRLTMQKALSFELTVIDAETRDPIEDYFVQCVAERVLRSDNSGTRLGGPHPGGVVTVDSVWRGECVLAVLPKSHEYWISDTIRFVAADPIEPMTVELRRMVPTSVRVELQDGTPVVGSEVELILPTERPIEVEDWYIDSPFERRDAIVDVQNGKMPALVMSTGHTNSDGIASLLRAPNAVILAARALGPGHRPAVLNGQAPPPSGTPLVITVIRGAGLKGRLLGTAYREYEGESSIKLVTAAEGWMLESIPVETDGTFSAEDLEPGAYELRFAPYISFRGDRGGAASSVTLAPKLGVVVLEPGVTCEIELDSDVVRPGSIRGVALLNGDNPGAARLGLRGRSGDQTFQCGQYVPAPDGSFVANALPPGEYRATLWTQAEDRRRRYLSSQVFTLRPGESSDMTFDFEDRVLHVRLLDEHGESPLSNTECRAWKNDSFWTERTSDEDGWVVIDPAPPFGFELSIDGHGEVGPLEMPAGQREARIEVRVPPKDQ